MEPQSDRPIDELENRLRVDQQCSHRKTARGIIEANYTGTVILSHTNQDKESLTSTGSRIRGSDLDRVVGITFLTTAAGTQPKGEYRRSREGIRPLELEDPRPMLGSMNGKGIRLDCRHGLKQGSNHRHERGSRLNSGWAPGCLTHQGLARRKRE